MYIKLLEWIHVQGKVASIVSILTERVKKYPHAANLYRTYNQEGTFDLFTSAKYVYNTFEMDIRVG